MNHRRTYASSCYAWPDRRQLVRGVEPLAELRMIHGRPRSLGSLPLAKPLEGIGDIGDVGDHASEFRSMDVTKLR